MNQRVMRMRTICAIINAQIITNQDQLQKALLQQGIDVTQATLSRDLRDLCAEKKIFPDGLSRYTIPNNPVVERRVLGINPMVAKTSTHSVDFCGQFAIVKTRPGFASAVAYDIDSRGQEIVLGTIAGDDTILIIPREGVSQKQIRTFLEGTNMFD